MEDLQEERIVENEHEHHLGIRLRNAMAQFICGAQSALIPPGQLGAGMGTGQWTDATYEYDEATGVLTITGIVKVTVYRNEPRET